MCNYEHREIVTLCRLCTLFLQEECITMIKHIGINRKGWESIEHDWLQKDLFLSCWFWLIFIVITRMHRIRPQMSIKRYKAQHNTYTDGLCKQKKCKNTCNLVCCTGQYVASRSGGLKVKKSGKGELYWWKHAFCLGPMLSSEAIHVHTLRW